VDWTGLHDGQQHQEKQKRGREADRPGHACVHVIQMIVDVHAHGTPHRANMVARAPMRVRTTRTHSRIFSASIRGIRPISTTPEALTSQPTHKQFDMANFSTLQTNFQVSLRPP